MCPWRKNFALAAEIDSVIQSFQVTEGQTKMGRSSRNLGRPIVS
jgi:hypothetical protein